MANDNVLEFVDFWKDNGDEKSDTQKFWLGLLRDVLDVENPESLIEFEKPVKRNHVNFIDAYIEKTRTLIEQKSSDVNLDKNIAQSDHDKLTPYEQAKRYDDCLPFSERARWIIICNFQELRIYDMEHNREKPEIILLSSLDKEWYKLKFLIDANARSPRDFREVELSIKAGELVRNLYNELLKRYIDPDDLTSQRSLNIFCVRVVFLLYAEDAGLFYKNQFHDYLKARENTARLALKELFEILDQKPEERMYIEEDMKAFPYVDGGLFAEKDIEIPQLEGEPLRIILEDMSEGFDWSGISTTIFGAVFESTLNPATRHSGGMHYTSIENIHKVIDPLFLDDLKAKFKKIISLRNLKERAKRLRDFQKYIASLKFFDPACGSGNFLTEAYLSLRRLENKILAALSNQISFTTSGEDTPIKISISQFYGLEVNDFAVAVARTALWISEAQMWNEASSILFCGELLPLKTYNHITEANALKTDWREICTPDFIMGNPPFLGYSIQTKDQKQEIISLFVDEKGKPYRATGKIDYVAGWYFKAAEFIHNTQIRAAFVSTNSITQGEQVSAIFKPLTERFNIHIDFAHTSFVWNNESLEKKAQVHVVVIAFSTIDEPEKLKRIYAPDETFRDVEHINFYLEPAPNVWIDPRKNPICKDAPEMLTGNMPRDGGNLLLAPEEKNELLRREPKAKKFIRLYVGSEEFINNIRRYCLWLVDAKPHDLKRMPAVYKRMAAVRKFRLASKREQTRKQASTAWLFCEIRQPKTNVIAIPKTSSESRDYIPIGWLDKNTIPGDALKIILDADLYHFGILTSRVHMAWTRKVCGRLKSDYRYSNTIVYNNFIWPSVNEKQRDKIKKTAQKILDARALYPESSFAELYDNLTMPIELYKAHRENDEAVCEAYGFSKNISEDEIVAKLFELYKNKIEGFSKP